MHAASARQPHRRIVGVVCRVKHDDFVARPHDGLDGRIERLGGAQRHSDLRLPVGLDAVGRLELAGNHLAQGAAAFHGRVLIEAVAHRLRQQFADARIDVVIGEALPEIQGAQFAGAPRHDGEDGRAHIGQLAARKIGHRYDSRLAIAAPITPAWPAKRAGRSSASHLSRAENSP